MTEPVFVDRSGRRRRVVALAGSAGALVLVLAVLALVAGFTGVAPATLPGWAESGTERLRGDTTPPPAAPSPTPSAGLRPRVTTPAAPPDDQSDAGATTRPTLGASTSTSAVAAPPGNSHRRIPTHTPSARPGKKH
ncbi:hypothetical protein AB0M36_35705 [Actinoplanes sp. NPDC051346]|uniref:hypothetical protein n=1 Tax=Actinoplanes sp. NPDC051346 TaxID=3155048 RepID=UPI0034202847